MQPQHARVPVIPLLSIRLSAWASSCRITIIIIIYAVPLEGRGDLMEVGGHRRTTLMESVFSNHAFGSSIMAGCDGGRRFDPAGLPDPHSHQTSRFGNDISSFNEDKSSRPDLHRCRWTDVRRLVSTWDAPFAAINESPSHPSVRRPSLRCLKLNHLLLTFLITAGTFMRRPAAHKPNAINNRHFLLLLH